MTFEMDLYFDPAPPHGRGPEVLGEDHSQLIMATGCSQVTAKLQNGTLNFPDEPTDGVSKGGKQTEVLELDSSGDDSDSIHEIGVGIPDEPTNDVSKETTQTVVLELNSSSDDSDSVHDY